MIKIAGTSWGANSAVLKQVYTGYVRPVMEYASTSWSTSASSNKAVLEKSQNWGLRMVPGMMTSNPIFDMETTSYIEPLDNRRRTKIIMLSEQMRILPLHRLHSRLSGSRSRLKRKSLNHLVKDLRREHDDILQSYLGHCDKLASDRWQHTELDA